MNNAAFKHLIKHFRDEKANSQFCVMRMQSSKPINEQVRLIKSVGGLERLYWQALGNGLTNLAKGIRRYTSKLKAHAQVDGL
ncbi:hypothetical protein [Shewanella subflava]|uniref:Uncharacterized protein n=1 Tax=Shewanella subflava TaxID=2986476 RepID=A0ABT3I592_9GAMM|nr:hypothetical protein [Shewanella subflava]MCW3171236.1 hypothetical protein [Shewanella subflava]